MSTVVRKAERSADCAECGAGISATTGDPAWGKILVDTWVAQHKCYKPKVSKR